MALPPSASWLQPRSSSTTAVVPASGRRRTGESACATVTSGAGPAALLRSSQATIHVPAGAICAADAACSVRATVAADAAASALVRSTCRPTGVRPVGRCRSRNVRSDKDHSRGMRAGGRVRVTGRDIGRDSREASGRATRHRATRRNRTCPGYAGMSAGRGWRREHRDSVVPARAPSEQRAGAATDEGANEDGDADEDGERVRSSEFELDRETKRAS